MRVLAISGSLQQRSANLALLEAARGVLPAGVTLAIAQGVAALPLFNPELDVEPPLEAVAAWRAELRAAQAVVIATPEYAHGYPGALKNALDWVVGSGELVGKPIALLSASTGMTGGIRALVGLTQVLSAMDSAVVDMMTVPTAKAKLDAEGRLTDPETLRRLEGLLASLTRVAGRAISS